MTHSESVAYVHKAFKHESELVSYAHENTDDGIFTKEQYDTFSDEDQKLIAEDLQSQLREEIYWLTH